MAFIGKKYFSGEAKPIPREWSVYDGVNEFRWWPKCFYCSAKDARQRKVPVEEYGFENVRATSLNCRKNLVIDVECHGKRQAATIEIPTWWGETMEKFAVSKLVFFGPEKPDDGEVRWIGNG